MDGLGNTQLMMSSTDNILRSADVKSTLIETLHTSRVLQPDVRRAPEPSLLAPKVNEQARARMLSILEKLNAALQAEGGEEVDKNFTPESAADYVERGVRLLFQRYESDHSDVDRDTMLKRFFSAVRDGVERGYEEGTKIAKESGAFEVDGVESEVQRAKKLIDERITAFEEELQITPLTQNTTSEQSAESNKALAIA